MIEQAGGFEMENRLDESHRLVAKWCPPVGLRDLGAELRRIEAFCDPAFLDVARVACLLQRQGEYDRLAIAQEAIAIDPSFLGVFHSIVDHKKIDGCDQLEIS